MTLLYSKQLSLGWQAKDFKLKNVDAKEYSLANFSDKQGLLIIFTCNHCPYAQVAWPLLIDLHKRHKKQVHFVAINPNDAENYPEDSFAEMQKIAKELDLSFFYLRDKSQTVAKKYKAQCTPDLYLFEKNGDNWELFYHGRINDNWQNPDDVTVNNLADALQALVKGKSAPDKQPPSMGCSIKWK